jgi:putative ABC transport system ATP-binding protein
VSTADVRLESVWRTYGRQYPVPALRDVTVRFTGGEVAALVGNSGSGKSTMLYILGLLDRPSEGRYLFHGNDVAGIGESARARLRASHIGFVFQQFHLLPYRTALENVELALQPTDLPRAKHGTVAHASLAAVGLGHRAHHYPDQMSGGEQQRVAVARALATNPTLLLCDEPTGNLDSRTGDEIIRLILGLRAPFRVIVLVTHDMAIARRADRVLELADGTLIGAADP